MEDKSSENFGYRNKIIVQMLKYVKKKTLKPEYRKKRDGQARKVCMEDFKDVMENKARGNFGYRNKTIVPMQKYFIQNGKYQ